MTPSNRKTLALSSRSNGSWIAGTPLEAEDNYPLRGSSTAPYPSKERDLVEGAGAECEARMRRRNDYRVVVVWAALIGLIVVARWFKVRWGDLPVIVGRKALSPLHQRTMVPGLRIEERETATWKRHKYSITKRQFS